MGASLGALAALHAQRRHADLFGGLFLQSGSFFNRKLDPQESGFARFGRITRFVADTQRRTLMPVPVPVTMTCGELEENLGNNWEMADACGRRAAHWPSSSSPTYTTTSPGGMRSTRT
jgi:pimeloyl-ACP methyl ester carboxylesterase